MNLISGILKSSNKVCRNVVDISCRIMVVGSKSPKKDPGFFFLKFDPNILEIKVNNKNKKEEEQNRL